MSYYDLAALGFTLLFRAIRLSIEVFNLEKRVRRLEGRE